MPFSGDSDIDLRPIDDNTWTVRRGFSYRGEGLLVNVAAGTATDFTSVPRVFVSLLPPFNRYLKAAILRDYLWGSEVSGGTVTPLKADALFLSALRDLNVGFLHRWLLWAAVRWGALAEPKGRAEWWKEGWRVMLITVLAAPIILPLVLVNAVTFVVFDFAQVVLWVPGKLGAWMKARGQRNVREPADRGRPLPARDRPSLGWKT